MTRFKIPGMSYTVMLSQGGGRHALQILLKDTPIASSNLQSYTKDGIKIAMGNALKEAEIMIPSYTVDDLTEKLYENSGYLESAGMSQEDQDSILIEKLTSIEARLANIEKKLGI